MDFNCFIASTLKFTLLISFAFIELTNGLNENFYAFGTANGDATLETGDDVLLGPINISPAFPYFGASYSAVYVEINGLLCFDDSCDYYDTMIR